MSQYHKEWRRKKAEQGLCTTCGRNPVIPGTIKGRVYKTCSECIQKSIARTNASLKNYRKVYRDMVFKGYGEVCKCCSESEREFLELDHVWGGGSLHTLIVGGGIGLYRWAIKNNYPSDLQLLCANCHLAKTRRIEPCPCKSRNRL